MIWLKLALCAIAGTLVSVAFMFKSPEYAIISGVVFAFAIGLE